MSQTLADFLGLIIIFGAKNVLISCLFKPGAYFCLSVKIPNIHKMHIDVEKCARAEWCRLIRETKGKAGGGVVRALRGAPVGCIALLLEFWGR